MWICPLCKQKFVRNNQVHSCGDNTLDDFLKGKSEQTIELFWYFADSFQQFGQVGIHPTKSMIGFTSKTRIAYVIRLGKNFVDVVFPFDRAYSDNLCFHKIAQVPGTQQFNHHLRIFSPEDLNTEVKKFMKLAFHKGS
jgi:Domain of unknown function (DUF5655)